MTHQDLDALIEIALRAPRTQAETLWLSALLQRLEAERQAAAAKEAAETQKAPEG